MITIKEIAKLAKVSPGTVDRVIHNREGVSEKTAERIRVILKEHNFKVNRIAQSLAMKKKYTIAVLMPGYDEENPFWRSPLEGIQKAKEEVRSFGVAVETFYFDQKNPKTYIDSFGELLKANPQGVVLVPTFKKETKELTNILVQENIPYVFLNIALEGYNNLSFIGQDSYKSGYLAGKLMQLCLKENDHILTVHSRPDLSNFNNIEQRIKGFDTYFKEKHLKNTNHSIEIVDFWDTEKVKAIIFNLLKEEPKIKGIFVPNSRSYTIADHVSGFRAKIPFLIGFDTTEPNLHALMDEKITFLISQKPFQQGYRAISSLSKLLLYNEIPQTEILSSIEIVTKENIPVYQEKQHTIFL
ncbi:LacI family DNA-binding transcriptional regulator [Flagellimonas pacifica]|uniref:Transcriptional regulator, LacI family n=1 Tax=Flagellimonas pacifica TaxID=1247520 RepID=A0A285MSF1_9FLAO|nr:LacI family DNA-binding transcriptional regulator [Allomuricauda parva]SNZ00048.1 transcriptional regulator, LacI family [Allomuricauda parva]